MRWPAVCGYWLSCYRRAWRASVFSSFVAPLLYLGSFGFGLGGLVDDGPGGAGLGGLPYVVFVAPGVLAATAMQTAFGESSYPVLGAMIWGRRYLAQVATPLTTTDVFAGHLAFVGLRTTFTTGAFLAVGASLGTFRSWGVLLALPVAVICGLAHAPAVMGFTIRQTNDYGLVMLFRFALVPAFLFAGTFFPVEQLPTGLRAVAWATPLWHGTTLCRELALGTAGPLPALGHLGYLGLWIAAGSWFAVHRYRSALAA